MLTSARWSAASQGAVKAGSAAHWGPGLKSGGCSHLHPPALQLEHSCPQGADPTEEGLPMFRRRDAQAHQVSAKKNEEEWVRPSRSSPSLCLDRDHPESGPTGPPIEAGQGPGFPPLTAQSWRPRPPGSHSQLP